VTVTSFPIMTVSPTRRVRINILCSWPDGPHVADDAFGLPCSHHK
jgi:hypothetical protein